MEVMKDPFVAEMIAAFKTVVVPIYAKDRL